MAINLVNDNISTIEIKGKKYNIKAIPFHGTAAEWENNNYIPKDGEIIIYDIDENYNYKKIKIGNGTDIVSVLPFLDEDIDMSVYETKEDAQDKLAEAQAYTDSKISTLGALAKKSTVIKSDLEESVQDSLNKANSALQSYTETDPTVPAWAKETNKPTYTASEVGLGNVNNTSDANKPVSTAQAIAIADAKKTGTDAQNTIDAHNENKSNPHQVTAAQVGAEAKGTISIHNTATDAHNDIRDLITDLTTKLNNFLDVDDTTADQLSEVLTLIENNKGTLESLTSSKVNVADIVNDLTTNVTNKPLSAAQGVVIKSLIDTLQIELNEALADEVSARTVAISTAKNDAISTAASDATTKANEALETAKEYTTTQLNNLVKIPAVSNSDNGKFLRVVSGVWTAVAIPSAEEASF